MSQPGPVKCLPQIDDELFVIELPNTFSHHDPAPTVSVYPEAITRVLGVEPSFFNEETPCVDANCFVAVVNNIEYPAYMFRLPLDVDYLARDTAVECGGGNESGSYVYDRTIGNILRVFTTLQDREEAVREGRAQTACLPAPLCSDAETVLNPSGLATCSRNIVQGISVPNFREHATSAGIKAAHSDLCDMARGCGGTTNEDALYCSNQVLSSEAIHIDEDSTASQVVREGKKVEFTMQIDHKGNVTVTNQSALNSAEVRTWAERS